MIEDGIGYIKVDALTKGMAAEVAAKVKSLEKSGAKKLVLDLRNDADGNENEGVAVANLFLNHGTITYVQGQKYPKEAFNADPAKAITSLPLAVLVNRGTAGAAEVVAAAILENARGDVVGDKTFGDGSVQKTIDLPDGGALILSIAKYYSPSGKAIQDSAVTPNVLVADEEDNVIPDEEEEAPAAATDQEAKPKNTQDDQLKKAIAGMDVQVLHFGMEENPYEGKAVVKKFETNMAQAYAAADFAICRCGAGTVAELIRYGVPSLLIPYPFAYGHQEPNGDYLVKLGGAKMVLQKMRGRNYPRLH